MIDPSWMLDEGTKMMVTKLHDGNYKIEEVGGDRKVTISYTNTGRMLFDGEDVETEEFMSYVILLDDADAIDLRVVYLENNW